MVWRDLRHDVLANQNATHVRTWIRGPTRARTDIPEAKTSANDMWAQNTTQPRKAEVGWAHWVAGRPP